MCKMRRMRKMRGRRERRRRRKRKEEIKREEKEGGREGPLLPRVVIPPSRRREWGK